MGTTNAFTHNSRCVRPSGNRYELGWCRVDLPGLASSVYSIQSTLNQETIAQVCNTQSNCRGVTVKWYCDGGCAWACEHWRLGTSPTTTQVVAGNLCFIKP